MAIRAERQPSERGVGALLADTADARARAARQRLPGRAERTARETPAGALRGRARHLTETVLTARDEDRPRHEDRGTRCEATATRPLLQRGAALDAHLCADPAGGPVAFLARIELIVPARGREGRHRGGRGGGRRRRRASAGDARVAAARRVADASLPAGRRPAPRRVRLPRAAGLAAGVRSTAGDESGAAAGRARGARDDGAAALARQLGGRSRDVADAPDVCAVARGGCTRTRHLRARARRGDGGIRARGERESGCEETGHAQRDERPTGAFQRRHQ